MRKIFLIIVCGLMTIAGFAQAPASPDGLMVNLIEHPDRVYANGYLTKLSLAGYIKVPDNYQVVEINQQQPFLGWVVNDSRTNIKQTAYQVLVSSDKDALLYDKADCWNSGKVKDDNSVAVKYAGKPLEPRKVYYWKVRTWNNGKVSSWSDPKSFVTAKELKPYAVSRYPLQKTDEPAVKIEKVADNILFADFGKAAFGRVRITLSSLTDTVLKIHLGEVVKNGRIDRNPGETRRYRMMNLPVTQGTHTYTVNITPDARNTGKAAIKIPSYIGEVMPFRYCEIEGLSGNLKPADVVRESVHYYFNDEASWFTSSNKVLNDVWNLCKYSVKATSFTGVYVDGDRERIPYEADALINQLCHYNVDREYSMARFSHEYLMKNPTWPTEWILQSVLIAWNDYLYTGNAESLRMFYNDLKAKCLLPLADETGLISSKTGKQTRELLKTIHFSGKEIRDIVDWPQSGILGVGKNEPGETDGFVFKDVNAVVNAYHYRALMLMSRMAAALGNKSDAEELSIRAGKVRRSFNELLFDSARGVYRDGVGTEHSALHSNMFALAFGLVPETSQKQVAAYIRSRGMACSVYGAQFLLDALYEAHLANYGLELLASTSERSWAHMLYDVGSTITLEAWDNKYKPNQDWNHAWGAAPANLIPRKLMGIEPLEPGFARFAVKPLPGNLDSASICLPTIRGNIRESFVNRPGKSFELHLSIPANSVADVYLPVISSEGVLVMDGRKLKPVMQNGFITIEKVGSGNHLIRSGSIK